MSRLSNPLINNSLVLPPFFPCYPSIPPVPLDLADYFGAPGFSRKHLSLKIKSHPISDQPPPLKLEASPPDLPPSKPPSSKFSFSTRPWLTASSSRSRSSSSVSSSSSDDFADFLPPPLPPASAVSAPLPSVSASQTGGGGGVPPARRRRRPEDLMSFEQKQRDAELREKHMEISRLLRQGRAKLSEVPATEESETRQQQMQLPPPLPRLEPQTSATDEEPEARRTEAGESAESGGGAEMGGEEEESETESVCEFEAGIFAKCPVKGCGEYLSRKIWFAHLVTYHSCKYSAYLKDMRMAKDRKGERSGGMKLCGLDCDSSRFQEERSLYESLNFAGDNKRVAGGLKMATDFARLENEDFQSSIVAVATAKERRELRRLLPGVRNSGRANDVLAMIVTEANELTEDSRFRLAKYLVVISRALKLTKESEIRSLTSFAETIEKLEDRKFLEEEVVHALKSDKKYPLTDTEIAGNIIDNAVRVIRATARFAARFIRNIRSGL